MRKLLSLFITALLYITAGAQTPYNVVMNLYQDPKAQMAFNWFTVNNTTG